MGAPSRLSRFVSLEHARATLVNWQDDYKQRHRHGSLGRLTPSEFAKRGEARSEAKQVHAPPDSSLELSRNRGNLKMFMHPNQRTYRPRRPALPECVLPNGLASFITELKVGGTQLRPLIREHVIGGTLLRAGRLDRFIVRRLPAPCLAVRRLTSSTYVLRYRSSEPILHAGGEAVTCNPRQRACQHTEILRGSDHPDYTPSVFHARAIP